MQLFEVMIVTSVLLCRAYGRLGNSIFGLTKLESVSESLTPRRRLSGTWSISNTFPGNPAGGDLVGLGTNPQDQQVYAFTYKRGSYRSPSKLELHKVSEQGVDVTSKVNFDLDSWESVGYSTLWSRLSGISFSHQFMYVADNYRTDNKRRIFRCDLPLQDGSVCRKLIDVTARGEDSSFIRDLTFNHDSGHLVALMETLRPYGGNNYYTTEYNEDGTRATTGLSDVGSIKGVAWEPKSSLYSVLKRENLKLAMDRYTSNWTLLDSTIMDSVFYRFPTFGRISLFVENSDDIIVFSGCGFFHLLFVSTVEAGSGCKANISPDGLLGNTTSAHNGLSAEWKDASAGAGMETRTFDIGPQEVTLRLADSDWHICETQATFTVTSTDGCCYLAPTFFSVIKTGECQMMIRPAELVQDAETGLNTTWADTGDSAAKEFIIGDHSVTLHIRDSDGNVCDYSNISFSVSTTQQCCFFDLSFASVIGTNDCDVDIEPAELLGNTTALQGNLTAEWANASQGQEMIERTFGPGPQQALLLLSDSDAHVCQHTVAFSVISTNGCCHLTPAFVSTIEISNCKKMLRPDELMEDAAPGINATWVDTGDSAMKEFGIGVHSVGLRLEDSGGSVCDYPNISFSVSTTEQCCFFDLSFESVIETNDCVARIFPDELLGSTAALHGDLSVKWANASQGQETIERTFDPGPQQALLLLSDSDARVCQRSAAFTVTTTDGCCFFTAPIFTESFETDSCRAWLQPVDLLQDPQPGTTATWADNAVWKEFDIGSHSVMLRLTNSDGNFCEYEVFFSVARTPIMTKVFRTPHCTALLSPSNFMGFVPRKMAVAWATTDAGEDATASRFFGVTPIHLPDEITLSITDVTGNTCDVNVSFFVVSSDSCCYFENLDSKPILHSGQNCEMIVRKSNLVGVIRAVNGALTTEYADYDNTDVDNNGLVGNQGVWLILHDGTGKFCFHYQRYEVMSTDGCCYYEHRRQVEFKEEFESSVCGKALISPHLDLTAISYGGLEITWANIESSQVFLEREFAIGKHTVAVQLADTPEYKHICKKTIVFDVVKGSNDGFPTACTDIYKTISDFDDCVVGVTPSEFAGDTVGCNGEPVTAVWAEMPQDTNPRYWGTGTHSDGIMLSADGISFTRYCRQDLFVAAPQVRQSDIYCGIPASNAVIPSCRRWRFRAFPSSRSSAVKIASVEPLRGDDVCHTCPSGDLAKCNSRPVRRNSGVRFATRLPGTYFQYLVTAEHVCDAQQQTRKICTVCTEMAENCRQRRNSPVPPQPQACVGGLPEASLPCSLAS